MVTKKRKKSAATDVLSHKLIPDMKVLSDGEKTKMLKKYGIEEHQLPKIRSNDPAVAALKAEPGNVLCIERDDGTGKYVAYRIVID